MDGLHEQLVQLEGLGCVLPTFSAAAAEAQNAAPPAESVRAGVVCSVLESLWGSLVRAEATSAAAEPPWVAACLQGSDMPLFFLPATLPKVGPAMDAVLERLLHRLPTAVIVIPQGLGPTWASVIRQRWRSSLPPSVSDRILLVPRLDVRQRWDEAGIEKVWFGNGGV